MSLPGHFSLLTFSFIHFFSKLGGFGRREYHYSCKENIELYKYSTICLEAIIFLQFFAVSGPRPPTSPLDLVYSHC